MSDYWICKLQGKSLKINFMTSMDEQTLDLWPLEKEKVSKSMQLIKYFFLRPKAHSGIVQFSVLFCFILFCFVFIGNIYKYLKIIF